MTELTGGCACGQVRFTASGAPLYGTTSRAPDIVMVMAGALDDPFAVTPSRIFFAEEAIPWDHARIGAAP